MAGSMSPPSMISENNNFAIARVTNMQRFSSGELLMRMVNIM
jgi:hypothetical protein